VSLRRRADRGNRYEVRWTEGGRHHGRLFERRSDAAAFDLDIRRRQQLGTLAPSVIRSHITLTDFVRDEWWPTYAVPNLKPRTREVYAQVYGKHVAPRIGGYELGEITPALVEDFRRELHAAGVGQPTQIKALGLLQGICKRAVVRGLIEANPVLPVDKPKQNTRRRVEPLPPLVVERMRALMTPPDAMLVSMLAYTGTRPEEALRSRWRDLGHRTLQVYAEKTERPRVVDLLVPLAKDLATWRAESGRPAADELIFPRRSGRDWQEHDWRNWRRRVYQPAAREVGVTGDMRPRRLRSSFVSLLLWEGRSLTYVADQVGASVDTLARHYAGVIRELEGLPRVPAAEAIRLAREELDATASGRL
jgi:integrase